MTFDKLRARWHHERAEAERQAAARKAKLLEVGPAIFARYGIQKAVLFGSSTTGTSTAASDVDLLVIPLTASQFWELRRELEDAADYPLDLYTQADDPLFVKKILERGEVIYETQP